MIHITYVYPWGVSMSREYSPTNGTPFPHGLKVNGQRPLSATAMCYHIPAKDIDKDWATKLLLKYVSKSLYPIHGKLALCPTLREVVYGEI
jgi:hypothetical protein